MDLFRYNASGNPDYTNGRDGETTYFSTDGGATLSNGNDPAKGAPTLSYNNQYNSNGTFNNGGDTADWSQTQVFGSTGGGETLTLTQTELDVMEALGWNLSLKQDVFDGALGGWETPHRLEHRLHADHAAGRIHRRRQRGMIVTLNSNVTVHSIATGANAEFSIGNSTACTLIAIDGTDIELGGHRQRRERKSRKHLASSRVPRCRSADTFDNSGTLAIGKGAGGSGDGAFLYLNDTLDR